MPATRSSALRCASVLLALALITGCTSEAAPSPTATAATPAASASPTATPTVSATSDPTIEKITTPPPVPADLTTPGKVGSKAAVEHFVALYGYTLNTGDTSLLRAASTETCEYCLDLAEGIEEGHESGWEYVGEQLRIERIELYEPESSENRHLWVVAAEVAPSQRTSPDGERATQPTKSHTTALLAVWTGHQWKVTSRLNVREGTGTAS
nr:DUF6318 family protein [Sanguibacter hominis]